MVDTQNGHAQLRFKFAFQNIQVPLVCISGIGILSHVIPMYGSCVRIRPMGSPRLQF